MQKMYKKSNTPIQALSFMILLDLPIKCSQQHICQWTEFELSTVESLLDVLNGIVTVCSGRQLFRIQPNCARHYDALQSHFTVW